MSYIDQKMCEDCDREIEDHERLCAPCELKRLRLEVKDLRELVSVTHQPPAPPSGPPRFIPTMEQVLEGLKALEAILLRQRDAVQGGYSGKTESGWSFVEASVMVQPEEFDRLFAAVGIVPDKIQDLGSCEDCVHKNSGAWLQPCCSCKFPRHTNFVPSSRVRKKL